MIQSKFQIDLTPAEASGHKSVCEYYTLDERRRQPAFSLSFEPALYEFGSLRDRVLIEISHGPGRALLVSAYERERAERACRASPHGPPRNGPARDFSFFHFSIFLFSFIFYFCKVNNYKN
jgi:hypothetical protein